MLSTTELCLLMLPGFSVPSPPADSGPLQRLLRPERLCGGADHRPVQVLLPAECLLQQALVGAVLQAAVHVTLLDALNAAVHRVTIALNALPCQQVLRRHVAPGPLLLCF